jgi:membrane protein
VVRNPRRSILLSSFADQRIDDDISRHIGLGHDGARIVETLFRGTPSHQIVPLLTGFLFSLAGVIATVSSLQLIYERIFGHEHRGWRDVVRWLAWTVVVIALLAVEATANDRVRPVTGAWAPDLISLSVSTLFFWWTMHFLLAGRTSWRRLARPAIATGVLWFAFALLSSLYFSPLIVSDSRLYGTIGVVFSLLTWFFLIGAVLVLGAVLGAVWQAHAEAKTRSAAA